MKRINNYTFLDEETNVVNITIDNVKYQSCLMPECQRFFKVTGGNHKYCECCRKKANIQNTVERRRQKKLIAKLECTNQ